ICGGPSQLRRSLSPLLQEGAAVVDRLSPAILADVRRGLELEVSEDLAVMPAGRRKNPARSLRHRLRTEVLRVLRVAWGDVFRVFSYALCAWVAHLRNAAIFKKGHTLVTIKTFKT